MYVCVPVARLWRCGQATPVPPPWCVDCNEYVNLHICVRRYPGGLKQRTATQVHEKDPSEVLRKAVSGMLPKNVLRTVSLSLSDVMSQRVQRALHPHGLCMQTSAGIVTGAFFGVQSRDRKLRIFPDADHPFKEHPRLVHWQVLRLPERLPHCALSCPSADSSFWLHVFHSHVCIPPCTFSVQCVQPLRTPDARCSTAWGSKRHLLLVLL